MNVSVVDIKWAITSNRDLMSGGNFNANVCKNSAC